MGIGICLGLISRMPPFGWSWHSVVAFGLDIERSIPNAKNGWPNSEPVCSTSLGIGISCLSVRERNQPASYLLSQQTAVAPIPPASTPSPDGRRACTPRSGGRRHPPASPPPQDPAADAMFPPRRSSLAGGSRRAPPPVFFIKTVRFF